MEKGSAARTHTHTLNDSPPPASMLAVSRQLMRRRERDETRQAPPRCTSLGLGGFPFSSIGACALPAHNDSSLALLGARLPLSPSICVGKPFPVIPANFWRSPDRMIPGNSHCPLDPLTSINPRPAAVNPTAPRLPPGELP
ncbi:hypothetical protein P7K49_036614 [Saguinus oedipus]|uniref:Uncharacterized protein n=1 Tax=Saguinus oedipus TaxID=9490 RepID=A0ABQ9TKT3_SAGOE|nr:hypothetical protein P7K49_036614 [Saguinus oedipus]